MRKLTYIPLVIALFLQWLFTIIGNLMEVLSNGFEEISIALENFTTHNGKTKPIGPPDSAATTGKGG